MTPRPVKAAVLSIFASCAGVLGASAGSPGPAVVHAAPGAWTGGEIALTRYGALRGRADKAGTWSWKGIPFAAPPVGKLRWKAPAPVRPWAGVKDATQPGSSCPQGLFGLMAKPSTTSENCLFLNVTAPAKLPAHKKLPVMVFIHGGGFSMGSGAYYDPTPLVEKGGVVAVTPNYRLGPFGFMATPELLKQGGDAGMYGVEDQQAALRWVKHNIAAFGGDPNNVTVFGESAGASSSCVHMVSPRSVGLFTRVAAESGCTLTGTSMATAEKAGTRIATKAGCTSGDVLGCLRGKSSDDIMNATPGNILGDWNVVYGGSVLPKPTITMFAEGKARRVPLLVGTNHDEGRLLIAFGPFGTIDSTTYPQIIKTDFGGNADKVLAQYPLSAYPSPTIAFATLFGDYQFSCNTLQAVQAQGSRAPVYHYEFNDTTAPNLIPDSYVPYPLGVSHGAELAYLFNLTSLNATQQANADKMIGYWARYGATGDPNGANASPWPQATTGQMMSLQAGSDHATATAGFSADHHCGLWQSLATS